MPTPKAAPKFVPAYLKWDAVLARARAAAPEAFGPQGQLLNLIDRAWGHPGNGRVHLSAVDATTLGALPMIDLPTAKRAVAAAHAEFPDWSRFPLDERRRRVAAFVAEARAHRELLTHLLMWEIGKPCRLALSDAERCFAGIEWYVDNIERMLIVNAKPRTPLGLVSNIASWNYPLSQFVHTQIVECLCGNSTIAKTPSDGGAWAITVTLAIARRHNLPVSLVSGSGGALSDALVRNDLIDCLAFVGGRSSGRDVAAALVDTSRRYMLELEGVNAYGIWGFSDWPTLGAQIKKSFEYAKQRCTAYPRFVVQRTLFPKFLDTYLAAIKSVKFGNPTLVSAEDDPLPDFDYGPLITSKKAEDLRGQYQEAIALGAIPLHRGDFDPANFLPGQDISAYVAPKTLLSPPRNAGIYHAEPFGPLDTIVVVDRIEELIAEMNVSNGCLVASVATDDPKIAELLQSEVRSFKFGHNVLRSRGDKDEPFGGYGQSWKGCFVGGKYLVEALTRGQPAEEPYGNFPGKVRVPPKT